jgi:tRNA/tmRNA/rRNA uracil-C5-methylase (TrmA/RlmC/RlmD family)
MPESPQEVTIKLDAMTYGGAALGRVDGKAVFVNGGLPGELVRVALDEDHTRFARGHVLEVITHAAERVTPPCPYFGFTDQACGGCQWQHMAYETQLRFKRDMRQLIQNDYALIDVQPIDLFPHTYHIETIALLKRADKAILEAC